MNTPHLNRRHFLVTSLSAVSDAARDVRLGATEADTFQFDPNTDIIKAPPEGFRLQAVSPALGHGLPQAALLTDLAGAVRANSRPINLGVYQHSK
jgi:hypothetical protein